MDNLRMLVVDLPVEGSLCSSVTKEISQVGDLNHVFAGFGDGATDPAVHGVFVKPNAELCGERSESARTTCYASL